MYSVIALFVCFIASYIVAEDIYAFLVRPLAEIYADIGVENPRMIYTALHEAFFTYLKLAFWAAVFLSFPVMAIQLWMFIAPGLYKNEKGAFLPFLIATPVLFIYLPSCLAIFSWVSDRLDRGRFGDRTGSQSE